MPGILPEDAFVEIVEGRISVDIVRNDPGPVVIATVAGGPLCKSFALASGVSAVVSTAATSTLTLVLEIALERSSQRPLFRFLTRVSSIMRS
jgi:hypothetical protein